MLLALVIVVSTALPVAACEDLKGKSVEQCTCANLASVLLDQIVDCESCHRDGCKQVISDSDSALLTDFDTTFETPDFAGFIGCLSSNVTSVALPNKLDARPPPNSVLAHLSTIRLLI